MVGLAALAGCSRSDDGGAIRPRAIGNNCPVWMCGANGPRVAGLALGDEEALGDVGAVTLPTGEMISLPGGAPRR
jgi:hypothetical protein